MHVSRAVAASLTSIILPLYQYPPSSSACWPTLTKALERSNATTTPWIIIVNPDSGPTTDKTDLYLRCLPALRETGANVKLVGYVPTGYGKTSPTHVRKQVAAYESWANLTVAAIGANGNMTTSKRALHKVVKQRMAIPLDGIFFDEVPSESKHLQKYAEYAGLVKQGQWNNGTKGEVRQSVPVRHGS